MYQNPHTDFTARKHLGDFPVGQSLSPQVDRLPLCRRQVGQQPPQFRRQVALLRTGRRINAIASDHVTIELLYSRKCVLSAPLPDQVHRAIAADGEEPRGHVWPNVDFPLVAEAQKRMLHHVPRCFVVTVQQARNITQEPRLERIECGQNPLAMMSVGTHKRLASPVERNSFPSQTG